MHDKDLLRHNIAYVSNTSDTDYVVSESNTKSFKALLVTFEVTNIQTQLAQKPLAVSQCGQWSSDRAFSVNIGQLRHRFLGALFKMVGFKTFILVKQDQKRPKMI